MIYRLEALDCYCDKCHQSFGADDSEPATFPGSGFTTDMREARRIMKEYGWKRTAGKDLCPKCAQRANVASSPTETAEKSHNVKEEEVDGVRPMEQR